MHFLLKRNRICLTINHNIAKHLRKLQHTVGSLLIVNINQRINVIQGIEQKMRVNLRFQERSSILRLSIFSSSASFWFSFSLL